MFVFQTRFERSRWFEFIKSKIDDGVIKRNNEAQKGMQLYGLEDIVRKEQPNQTRNPLMVEVIDDAFDKVRKTLNLNAINKRFIEHRKRVYETSTRKVMSLNELRNLPDTDNSKTFVTVKYSDDKDDEKILCFLDESEGDSKAKSPRK